MDQQYSVALPQKVISDQEAFNMLQATKSYFGDDNYLQGRHLTEKLVEGLISDGQTALAADVNRLHNALKEFHRGEFRSAGFFDPVETDLIEDLHRDAAKTRWSDAIRKLTVDLQEFYKPLTISSESEWSGIDWDASKAVLARRKAETFPEDLSMMERLEIWHDASKGSKVPGL